MVNQMLSPSANVNVTPNNPNYAIAQEVIAGKWGNGEERKKRLIAAGYNYNDVQALVGKLLK
ncbi:MAG: hypothetical protein K6C08_06190 [Oscillospiraceae bacterium]|nr:hypothetical protein [Oscillospiraceae bacterium]